MNKIRTGNIFVLNGNYWIATGESSYKINGEVIKTMGAVDFKHSNCSASFTLETRIETQTCGCVYDPYPDGEICNECQGTGSIQVSRAGMNQAILIADSCGAFIEERLKNIFYPDLNK